MGSAPNRPWPPDDETLDALSGSSDERLVSVQEVGDAQRVLALTELIALLLLAALRSEK